MNWVNGAKVCWVLGKTVTSQQVQPHWVIPPPHNAALDIDPSDTGEPLACIHANDVRNFCVGHCTLSIWSPQRANVNPWRRGVAGLCLGWSWKWCRHASLTPRDVMHALPGALGGGELERPPGIEPGFTAWKAGARPIGQGRK